MAAGDPKVVVVGGGISGTTNAIQEDRVWRAPIQADHSLGAWELAAPPEIEHVMMRGLRAASVS